MEAEAEAEAKTKQELEEYEKFFKNFYIYSNQKNVEDIENELGRLFAAIYRTDGQDIKYKKYFEQWCRDEPIEGCKDKLYKDDIALELQTILLEPYAKSVIPIAGNFKATLLRTAISKFDVTIIKEDCRRHIESLWETCQRCDYTTPLVVTVNRSNMSTVCKAIALYQRSFVLIGDVEANELDGLKVFRNLADLQEDDYRNVTENLSCVVQGRKSECLASILRVGNGELEGRLKRCFEVGHLLKMVGNETLVIGDDTVQLPTPYINRTIPKHCFSFDFIKHVSDDDVLVIACSDWDKLQKTVTDLKQVDTKIADCFVTTTCPLIVTLRGKCSSDQFKEICLESNNDKNVYCFEMLDDCLSLLNSHGNLSNLLKFREGSAEAVQDTDIFNNFMNKTNVLLGDPGMGKTICADFIKLICPFDFWPVKVNLREKLDLFLKFNCDDLLKRVLDSQSDGAGFRNCYEIERKILLIWDGLDEVETKNVDRVVEKVQELLHRGYVQWITSRCHLQEKLEDCLNVLSINLVEITADDQRNYIATRLGQTYESIHEVTDGIHERIITNKLKDFLGIPLLLFMFTEICLDPVKHRRVMENEISLIQIYGLFIDGKFEHFNQKIVQGENALFAKIEDEIKEHRTIKYQKAALKTCFEDKFSDQLDCEAFLKKLANDGDVYGIITKIGDGNMPIFIHKTFAEYFAAWYLSKKYHKFDSDILKTLFQPEHRNIRFLFDLFLSEDCPAHQAVLELNVDKLKAIRSGLTFAEDKGGRNVFHLVSSYGARRLPLQQVETSARKAWFGSFKTNLKMYSASTDNPEKENEDYEKIVRFLVGLAGNNIGKLIYKDKVYQLDFVEYANMSLSLYAIDAYSNMIGSKQVFCNNYKDSSTILLHSVVFDYKNLFSSLQDIPYFVLHRLDKPIRSKLIGTSVFALLSKFDVTILMIDYNQVDMLREALKHKNFINKINRMFDDENSLSWAVRKGNLDVVKLLVRNKVDTGKVYGMTKNNILHIAVTQRQLNIVKYIVREKFVPIDACNSTNETPLLIAAKLGHFHISKYLIDNGAGVVDIKNFYGENLLHNACKSGSLQLVRYLVLDQKLHLEKTDSFGNTPLLTAARAKDLQIFNFLIRAGANVYAKNAVGWNVLHCACSSGSFDFIRNLSRDDLVVLDTEDSPKDTPLLVAARYGYFDVASYLLKNGANVLAKNFHGKNVLHYACERGNLGFVKQGIGRENLAALRTPDSKGCEPLFYAKQGGHSLVKEYLDLHTR